MKELNREEKILKTKSMLNKAYPAKDQKESIKIQALANIIIDAIETQEIKVGMIGKFESGNKIIFGKLFKIDLESGWPYLAFDGVAFNKFTPMTPDEIKKELEKMRDE